MCVLVIPFALLLLLVCAFLFLLFKKWKAALIVFSFFLVLNIWSETCPLHISYFLGSEKGKDLKVLSYNVHSTDSNYVNVEDDIISFLMKEDADVVLLSECYTREAHVLDSVLKERYRVGYDLGNISMEKLYSKWPVDSIEVLKVDTTNAECQQLFSRKPELRGHFKHPLIYKTHLFAGKDTLTLVCCHLESSHVHGDSLSVGEYKSALEDAYTVRGLEADAIYESLSKEAYPMIVMGDLNDISGSYALRRIQSLGLYDAWWKGGAGYGRTFHEGKLNFRLDHILYSKDFFSLKQVNVVDDDKSDHNALTASFRFKNKVND